MNSKSDTRINNSHSKKKITAVPGLGVLSATIKRGFQFLNILLRR